MRSLRRAVVAVAMLPMLGASNVAFAQGTANDRAVAEALFRDAKQLVTAQNWSTACAKFAESQRLDPKLGTLLYLATCHEREGKLASAWIEFTEARALATRSNQPDREKLARTRAAALEPRLSKILVEAEAPAPNLVLELDGQVLSPAVIGSPFPVDPGEHTITATAPDREPLVLKANVVEEAQLVRVQIPRLKERLLEMAEPAPATPAPPVAPPVPAESSAPTGRTAGFVIGGLGIASLAVGGVLGFVALGKNRDADAFCSGKLCTREGLDKHDEAHTIAHFSTAGFALGAIGVGVGTYLVLSSKDTPRAAIAFPMVSSGALGVGARGSF